MIVGTIFDPRGALARTRHFKTEFSHRYHHSPDVFAAQGYDGVYTAATALRHTNSVVNRRALRASLADLKHILSVLSASGHFSFTAQRQTNLAPMVQIVRRGQCISFP